MAGLAAAWALTDPASDSVVESVTVYQRGWRLGGKGASSRGRHGRIEEHGLHVWLGYYVNAFRLLRQVYDELDRPSTAPDCPISSLRDAFLPAGRVGVAENGDGRWSRRWAGTGNRRCRRVSSSAPRPGGRGTAVQPAIRLVPSPSSARWRGRPSPQPWSPR